MNRQDAEQVYRNAWYQYCLTANETKRIFLEQTMDYAQPFIANGPRDPRWKEFTETLPGFQEYWDSWKRKMESFCRAVEEKKL